MIIMSWGSSAVRRGLVLPACLPACLPAVVPRRTLVTDASATSRRLSEVAEVSVTGERGRCAWARWPTGPGDRGPGRHVDGADAAAGRTGPPGEAAVDEQVVHTVGARRGALVGHLGGEHVQLNGGGPGAEGQPYTGGLGLGMASCPSGICSRAQAGSRCGSSPCSVRSRARAPSTRPAVMGVVSQSAPSPWSGMSLSWKFTSTACQPDAPTAQCFPMHLASRRRGGRRGEGGPPYSLLNIMYIIDHLLHGTGRGIPAAPPHPVARRRSTAPIAVVGGD
jgi:hypothetical protein